MVESIGGINGAVPGDSAASLPGFDSWLTPYPLVNYSPLCVSVSLWMKRHQLLLHDVMVITWDERYAVLTSISQSRGQYATTVASVSLHGALNEASHWGWAWQNPSCREQGDARKLGGQVPGGHWRGKNGCQVSKSLLTFCKLGPKPGRKQIPEELV